MFSTTLRKRPEFAPILSHLLSSKSPLWREESLEAHDIALPLPRKTNESNPESFRLLLLSESDGFDETRARIDRLCCATGEKQVGVMFLLREQFSGNGMGSGMTAYLKIQAWLLTSTLALPLIPLQNLSSLPKTLSSFHHSLLKTHPVPKPVNPVLSLLPYCTTEPPMGEHTANVMSDLTGSLKDLAIFTATEQGRRMLAEWVGEDKLEAVVGFWDVEVYVGT